MYMYLGAWICLFLQKRPLMKDFLLTIVMEGLEDKYNMLLSRGKSLLSISLYCLRCSVATPCIGPCLFCNDIPDCRVLKNRKFVGALPEQTVRQKPKPFIIEMERYVCHLHCWTCVVIVVKLICGVLCMQE